MAKRKFKRDYIMLEAKDLNFRLKEKASPKAFAKIEITDEKSVIALYAENLKPINEGYSVVLIRNDYETIDLGNFNVNAQGKGEFSLNILDDDIDIKGVAIIYDKSVPLIGFKGTKIDNFVDILFPPEYEYEEVEELDNDNCIDNEQDDEEYEEIEYIEIEEDDDDAGDEEYEEIDYIDDDNDIEYEYEEYEEVEYIEVDDDNDTERKSQIIEEVNVPEKVSINQKAEEKSKNEERIEKKINKAKSILEKQYSKNTSIENKSKREVQSKGMRTLLMPRQIKKGLKEFKEVKPFVDDYIENTRWWKIEINPTTMCGYTMPYLGYVNSLNYTMYSDIITQSYKYRHYLFGVQYDEYNKRQYYIYGTPGRKAEQPDRGRTGFTRYQACDIKNNSLGYWLCFIDCKARKIVK